MNAQLTAAHVSFGQDQEELIAARINRLRLLVDQSTEAEVCAMLEGLNAAMVVSLSAGGRAAAAIVRIRDEITAYATTRIQESKPSDTDRSTTITINPGTVLLVSEILRAERGETRRPYDDANSAICSAAKELMRTSAQNMNGETE